MQYYFIDIFSNPHLKYKTFKLLVEVKLFCPILRAMCERERLFVDYLGNLGTFDKEKT